MIQSIFNQFKIVILALLIVLTSCKNKTDAKHTKTRRIQIAVAASSQFAFRRLAEVFKTDYGVDVNVITGASGKLTTQIIQGAPYDIFVSANMNYPKVLVENHKTIGNVQLYGFGVPVFWTLYPYVNLETINAQMLTDVVKRIAIADPNNAPYGEMTVAYLKHHKLYDAVKSKLVFGESISQVNEYVLNKTVTLGVSAKSIVMSEKLRGAGRFKALDKTYYIKQGLVIIKNKTPTEIKVQFVNFVLSNKGKEILKSFGYAI